MATPPRHCPLCGPLKCSNPYVSGGPVLPYELPRRLLLDLLLSADSNADRAVTAAEFRSMLAAVWPQRFLRMEKQLLLASAQASPLTRQPSRLSHRHPRSRTQTILTGNAITCHEYHRRDGSREHHQCIHHPQEAVGSVGCVDGVRALYISPHNC